MGAIKIFLAVVFISMLYSMMVTLAAYAIPGQYSEQVTDYNAGEQAASLYSKDFNFLAPVEEDMERQLTIPYVNDIGSLVVHTGLIWLDLLLNFVTAVPAMFTLLAEQFFKLIPGIDPVVKETLVMIVKGAANLIWIVVIMAFFSELLTGRSVAGGVA